MNLLRRIPSNSAQLIVTSPPYNVGKEYEKRVPIDHYLESQRLIIEECVRIARPGGSICWQVGTHVSKDGRAFPLDILLYPIFASFSESHDIRLRNRIVWHYEHGLHCKKRFSGRHESILWFTKGDEYCFDLDAVRVPQKYPGKRAFKGSRLGQYTSNPLGKNPSDVWIIPNVKSNHVEKTGHPCQFPIELPERLILALTKHNDLVVDPYLGAGTTAVAAVLHGRRVAGSEIKKKYASIARTRISEAALGVLKRRPFGKPIYQPAKNNKLTLNPFLTLVA